MPTIHEPAHPHVIWTNDVTGPEPLPREHALWTVPNCFITPPIGGRHFGEEGRLVRHFLASLRRFEAGEPLVNRVF